MKLIKYNFYILISGIVLLLGAYAAQAQVASVSAGVNLRQGPGTVYGRIAALPRGVKVHINYCRRGWCQVRSSWGVGWVSGRYLLYDFTTGSPAAGDGRSNSQVYLQLDIGSGYFYDDYYSPFYHPNYRPYYAPYNPKYLPRPGGYKGWNPAWGVGPAHPPRRGRPR